MLTNWFSVRIPVELAAGVDALRAGGGGVRDAAIHIALLGAAVILVRSLSRIWFFTPARLSEYQLREDMFAHCMRLQPDFYRKFATGDLISRATSDITFARAFAGFGILQVFNVIGAVVMTLGQMLAISPLLTVACALPVALCFGFIQLGMKKLMTMQRQAQVLQGRLSDELIGTVQGVGTIQSFCVEAPFQARMDALAEEIRATNISLAKLRAWIFPTIALAGGGSVYLLLAIGGPMALEHKLSAGDLAAFISLTAYLLFPMMAMGFVVSVIQRSEASLERIYAVLDAPIERPELGRALPFPTPGKGPSLSIRNLSFGWTDRLVLKDIQVEIPAGATVGIFGRTGSGKTTLLRLLARLANPAEGTVLVGSTDLTRLDLEDWRRRVTLVLQTPFLFSETIAENVGFGADPEVIREAVGAAALEPDLKALPDGLNTVVGERGIVLSGGQRQRVALARGLARRSELLLLDDVLSAVDHRTEQELIRMLEERWKSQGNFTSVIVSHRMSVLERTDVVMVMDEGRVVDQGTHAELLTRPGLYQEAWKAQNGEAA